LIVGLKELNYNLDYVFNYNHLYFSHTFKNQSNSNYILNNFREAGGTIYDLEYFMDSNNKRLFAFGFQAGIAGCYLGLLQYYYKKQLKSINLIEPFNSYEELFNNIFNEYKSIYIQPDIAIIGNGKCSKGVIYLLNRLNLPYKVYTKDMKKDNLYNYNLIFNCILLTTKIDPFITTDTVKLFKDPTVIIDISCDYGNIYNPIPIYSHLSNFNEPVIKINNNVDVIAIDNLPSLLARNSSYVFSSKLINLFIDSDKSSWHKNSAIYRDKINSLN
jgi:saccharopine dehydrogenase (NAD+, L-lysine-forming)